MIIKNARFVVTPERILENVDILVENNIITEIGKVDEKKGEKIDAKGKLVLPGLINTHTHASMVLFRGAGDDTPLMEWLEKHIWPMEAKLTETDVYLGALLACIEMIKSGTTTFCDMYFHMDSVAKAVKDAGMGAVLSWAVIDKEISTQKGDPVNNAEMFIRRWHNEERIYPSIGPHSIYTCSKETLLRSKEISDRYNVVNHIHLSETKSEVEGCVEKNKMRPAEYLDSIGFFSEKTLAAHCIWLNEKEISILAENGVSVSHCPVSNMKLASGVMPLVKMQKEGVNISLGTDGAASNNSLDMFETMKLTALLHKLNDMNAAVANAEDVLKCATINGAEALYLEKEIGSIEIGKKADLIILNVEKAHWKPTWNPISNLVYSAKSCDVETVICNGKVIMQDRKILTLDEEKILDKIEKLKQKFMK
jgi:5-methylthioadenosine/S-adenosylhomocysteine deaminase